MFVLQQRNFVYNENWLDNERYRFIFGIKVFYTNGNVYRNNLLEIRG